jgi:prevent-host-death family protein
MTYLQASEARENMAEAINRVAYGGERVILRRRNKNAAAIISIADLALLEELENRVDLSAARKRMREHGSVPWKEVKKKLSL